MKLPDDVRQWLLRRYGNQHRDWLTAHDPARWPLAVPLGLPTEATALRQTDVVRAWVAAWQGWRGAGELRWAERRWPVLGTQRLPETLLLHDPGQAAAWIGEQERWNRAAARYQLVTARWPELAQLPACLYGVLADYGDADFERLLDLLAWLVVHPGSGLYPRQLPLPGIDSKWLEPRKGVVTELVAALRGIAAGGLRFYEVCGLKRPPATVRMRVLDAALRDQLGGLADISAPLEDLARLRWQPSTVLMVENLQSGLALGDLPGTVAFMALGYGVDVLASIPWITRAACVYWGDIDTHGYAILQRARNCYPHVASVMMDMDTLLRFRSLCTSEASQHAATELPMLTPEEQEVFRTLKANILGQALRLEQERIAWDIAWPLLSSAIGRHDISS